MYLNNLLVRMEGHIFSLHLTSIDTAVDDTPFQVLQSLTSLISIPPASKHYVF